MNPRHYIPHLLSMARTRPASIRPMLQPFSNLGLSELTPSSSISLHAARALGRGARQTISGRNAGNKKTKRRAPRVRPSAWGSWGRRCRAVRGCQARVESFAEDKPLAGCGLCSCRAGPGVLEKDMRGCDAPDGGEIVGREDRLYHLAISACSITVASSVGLGCCRDH